MPGPTLVTGKVAWGSGSCGGGCTSQATGAITSQTAGHMNLVSLSFCASVSCNSSTAGVSIPIPTDGSGNVYTQIYRKDGPNSNAGIAIFANTNIAASASNAVTCKTGSTVWYLACNASEWSGATSIVGSLIDQSGFFDSASAPSSPITITTIGNTVNNNEAAYVVSVGNATPEAASGYTQVTGDPNLWDQWKAVPTSGSAVIAQPTFTPPSNNSLSALITLNPTGIGGNTNSSWLTVNLNNSLRGLRH